MDFDRARELDPAGMADADFTRACYDSFNSFSSHWQPRRSALSDAGLTWYGVANLVGCSTCQFRARFEYAGPPPATITNTMGHTIRKLRAYHVRKGKDECHFVQMCRRNPLLLQDGPRDHVESDLLVREEEHESQFAKAGEEPDELSAISTAFDVDLRILFRVQQELNTVVGPWIERHKSETRTWRKELGVHDFQDLERINESLKKVVYNILALQPEKDRHLGWARLLEGGTIERL